MWWPGLHCHFISIARINVDKNFRLSNHMLCPDNSYRLLEFRHFFIQITDQGTGVNAKFFMNNCTLRPFFFSYFPAHLLKKILATKYTCFEDHILISNSVYLSLNHGKKMAFTKGSKEINEAYY